MSTPARIALSVVVALAPIAARAQAPRPFTATRDLTIAPDVADFARPGDMMVTRAGEVIVTDPDDKTIRAFSPTGVLTRFGHTGEGPGEFRNLRLAGLIGDSVWTSDPALDRVTIFSPDHKFARSFSYPGQITNPAAPREPRLIYEFLSPDALYPDGTLRLVVAVSAKGPKPSWVTADDTLGAIVIHTGHDGVFKARVGVSRNTPPDCQFLAGNWTFNLRSCAGPLTNAYSGTPEFVVVSAQNLLGPNSSYHVTLTDGDGVQRISRDYPIAPVAVPKSARDSELTRMEDRVKHDPAAVAKFANIKWPVTYPPVRAIVVGRDGTLWLDERHAAPGHHWLVLDRVGNPIGALALPENVALRVAELGAAWGLETDADGLVGVARYRLSRGR
jgi:hypothetical protein